MQHGYRVGYNNIMENAINDGLALKIFQNQCCENCSCKTESESQKISEIDNMGREQFWKGTEASK